MSKIKIVLAFAAAMVMLSGTSAPLWPAMKLTGHSGPTRAPNGAK